MAARIKSLWCLLAVIPSRENTRSGPRHAGGSAGAGTDGQRTSTVYTKLGCSGAPRAGDGMRGFYETTPCLLRAGFLKCENRHLKKTRNREVSGRSADGGGWWGWAPGVGIAV